MYKLKNIFEVNFEREDIYLYLFKAEWNKKIIDKNASHDYRGFENVIKTDEGWIINTGNYCCSYNFAEDIDNKLQLVLNTDVKTNFVSLLPKTNVGKHWDYYDEKKCNTSIVWKVYGDVEIHTAKDIETVSNNYALILNTDYIHDAYNHTKQVQWIATSLVYNITYDEVIEIFSKEGMSFF